VLIAALIVKEMPITYVRWMVVVVVVYTALLMLRSAMTERSVTTKAGGDGPVGRAARVIE